MPKIGLSYEFTHRMRDTQQYIGPSLAKDWTNLAKWLWIVHPNSYNQFSNRIVVFYLIQFRFIVECHHFHIIHCCISAIDTIKYISSCRCIADIKRIKTLADVNSLNSSVLFIGMEFFHNNKLAKWFLVK